MCNCWLLFFFLHIYVSMCPDVHEAEVNPHTPPTRHTPHHTVPPAASNIRPCGSSSTPNERRDTFHCFSLPPPPPSPSVRWRGETQQSLTFFSSSQKTVQLLFVFCHLSLLMLLLLLRASGCRQWLIENRPRCECIVFNGDVDVVVKTKKKIVPVLLRRRLNTSGRPLSLFWIYYYFLNSSGVFLLDASFLKQLSPGVMWLNTPSRLLLSR